MMMKLTKFLKKSSGATAIEYGLIAALIAVVIIGATRSLGTSTSEKLQEIATEISGAGSGAASGSGS